MFEKMSPNQLVCMKNELVRAAHGLTLMEKRLLMLAISKLDISKPALPQNMSVSIQVTEFIKQYGITAKSTYEDVKAAAEHLMDRYVRFFHKDEKGKTIETRMQWIGQANYKESEGIIELDFWYKLSPMLFELKNQFTSYRLSRAGALRSIYSWRLFELLMQFKSTGFLKIELGDFINTLDIPISYRKDFGLIRSKIIEPAIKEIREKDGLNIVWEAVKTGRKVTVLQFKFPIEQQTTLPFQTSEKPKTNPPKPTSKLKTQTDLENAYDLEHMKRLAELGGVPLETLLKRS